MSDVFELKLSRVMDAPRALVWKAWSDPEHLKQWWAPKPWTTPKCEMDLRTGGTFRTVMQGPDGQSFDNSGVFLEVVPQRKVVFTDAYVNAWTPSAKPFMTAIITMDDEGKKTKYAARVLHWSAADLEEHVKMGFHDGWGTVADQLAALAATL
jgi:uncharacterized protein YndB with AHSA1/START domain